MPCAVTASQRWSQRRLLGTRRTQIDSFAPSQSSVASRRPVRKANSQTKSGHVREVADRSGEALLRTIPCRSSGRRSCSFQDRDTLSPYRLQQQRSTTVASMLPLVVSYILTSSEAGVFFCPFRRHEAQCVIVSAVRVSVAIHPSRCDVFGPVCGHGADRYERDIFDSERRFVCTYYYMKSHCADVMLLWCVGMCRQTCDVAFTFTVARGSTHAVNPTGNRIVCCDVKCQIPYSTCCQRRFVALSVLRL